MEGQGATAGDEGGGGGARYSSDTASGGVGAVELLLGMATYTGAGSALFESKAVR